MTSTQYKRVAYAFPNLDCSIAQLLGRRQECSAAKLDYLHKHSSLVQSGELSAVQALLIVFPKPLLCELKASCADALAELLDACPGQSLSVKGATTISDQDNFIHSGYAHVKGVRSSAFA